MPPAAESPILTLTIADDIEPDRADKVLVAHFSDMSRSQIQRLLDEHKAIRAGKPLCRKDKIGPGDTIEISRPPPPPSSLAPTDMPLEILFEDEHLLAVNKASGMVTHPGAGTGDDTLVHAALFHTKEKLALAGGDLRPGIVHRLDKETSGVILLAKTDLAYHALVRQFSEREPDKQYVALVNQCPRLLSGSIREPIERHRTHRIKMTVREDGKPARTDWAVEERFGEVAARVRCWLHTGRTHQIRVHLTHIGHPLLGDKTYGKNPSAAQAEWPMPRVMLHAERITFPHPVTEEEMTLTAPLPKDFLALENFLRTAFGSRPVTKL